MSRFFFLCTFLILIEGGTAFAFSRGPLPYRNQFPLALLFFSFESDSAYIEENHSLRSEISYSSIFERGRGNPPNYFIDMEVARTKLEFKVRVNERLQVEGEISHIRVGAGFLDQFLRGYHRLLGVEVGSTDFPDNAYAYTVNGRGIHLDFSSPGGSFSDTALKIKLNLLKERSWYPSLSIKGALKFPTGGSNKFSGSGSTDIGISLLASRRIGDFVLHFNFSSIKIFSSQLARTQNDPLFYQGMAGVEWLLSPKLSMNFQVLSHKYPFSDTGIAGLENLTMEEVFGFKYRVRGFQVDFGFIEDTSDINFSPDFSTLLGLTWYGRGGHSHNGN